MAMSSRLSYKLPIQVERQIRLPCPSHSLTYLRSLFSIPGTCRKPKSLLVRPFPTTAFLEPGNLGSGRTRSGLCGAARRCGERVAPALVRWAAQAAHAFHLGPDLQHCVVRRWQDAG